MPLEQDDLNKISEMIAESNKTFIDTIFKDAIAETSKTISDTLGQQIGGLASRFTNDIKKIGTQMDSMKNEYTTGLQSIQSQNTNPGGAGEDRKDGGGTGNPDVDKLMTQLDNQAKQIENLTSVVQTTEQKRAELEKQTLEKEAALAQEKTFNQFISGVSEKVVDPNTFLQTCLNQGKIEMVDGQLVVDTGKLDTMGNKVYEPANDHVDAILGNGLKYFAKPRAGNGGGGLPQGSGANNTQAKYFTKESMEGNNLDATAIYEAMQAGKTEEVQNEFNQVLQ